jgi:hypothetical protein
MTFWPPLWSSGQNSWLQIGGPGSIPGTTRKKSGSGTWSTLPREYTVKLRDRKVAAPV